MKVSLNWLGDHIDLAGLDIAEICELLTFSGIEVESVDARGITSELLVVARIISSEPHPDADRLSVCQVDDGSGHPRQIVCGAKNYEVGDHVPLALPGASFGDFKIKRGKLRGVESMGMMCSGKEIGVGTDHEGLLILENRPDPGTPIADLFPSDTILELEITPNRPDCLSHFGIARELHALTGRPLKKDLLPQAPGSHESQGSHTDETIRLSDPRGCPFYTAHRITGVAVKESPEWLKSKLESIGLRPINNIVDITNFILMEMGHPLHAFDLAKLDGGIEVRRAVANETITTLDDEHLALDPEDLVIADQTKALAVAGIMGGADTGVSTNTTDILLESAWFHPSGIRRTSRRLGLNSDSSYRFERGADPGAVRIASDLAVKLICELAGGKPEKTLAAAGVPPVQRNEVSLTAEFCSRVLGCPISEEEIATTLVRLGLQQADKSNLADDTSSASCAWHIPSFRGDLTRPIDLVEEVARIRGLNTIPSRNHGPAADPSKADMTYDAGMQVRRHLAARGFNECTTLKLIARAQLTDALGLGTRHGDVIALKNPLSEDHTHLRSSIVPGLLASLSHNLRHGSSDLRLFEVGTCFIGETKRPAPSEIRQLAIAMTGKVSPPCWLEANSDTTTFHDLRGTIETLAPGCRITFLAASHEHFPLCATIAINDRPAGLAAQVAPIRARELGFDEALLVAEIDLSILQKHTSSDFQARDLPRYPSMVRDVAIEVPVEIPAADIDAFFARQEDPLLVDCRLFDVFTDPGGEKLPIGRRSLAYTLTYRDASATLRAEQVDAAHDRILEALQRELPATIR